MDKKRAYKIIFGAIVFLCLFGFLWSLFVTRDIRKNAAGALNKSQQLMVQNVILTETKEGVKYWEAYAKTGAYDAKTKDVVLGSIIGNLFDKNGEVSVSFEAQKGTYNETTKELHLEGDCFIISKDDNSIKCDEIDWAGGEADFIATGRVELVMGKDLKTYSDKAVSSSDLARFKIIGNSKSQAYQENEQKRTQLFK